MDMNKYYAELDEDTGLYCVFNTADIGSFPAGHAFSSWASLEQAELDAEARNGSLI